jgi:hypothetical protein
VHDQRHVLCKNALDNDLNKIETCAKNEVFTTSGGGPWYTFGPQKSDHGTLF